MAGTMLNSMSCQQQRQVTKHDCQPLGQRRNVSRVVKSLGCCNLLHARSLKSRKVARASIVVNSSASGSKSPSGDVASSSGSSNSYSNSDSNDPNRQRRPSPLLLTLQSLQKSCFKLIKVCWDEVTRLGTMILKERFLRLCLLLLLFPLLFNRFWGARTVNTPKEVLYSSFVTMVDQQKVQSARLETTSCRLFFELKPEQEAESLDVAKSPSAEVAKTAVDAAISQADPAAAERAQPQRMYIKLADKNDQYLMQHMIKSGVDFGVVRASFSTMVAQVVATSLALWLPLIPLFFILRSMMDSRRGVRPSKKSSNNYEKVVFDDVAGVDAAKEELTEVVACLKDAERYSRLKVKMPSGVLLCGPPGTGKTLLARAVAGEAGVPFIAVSASEFVEMFVGRGAARIRELFAEARKLSPCVVFIDELDAVGGIRGRGFNDERDQTLNQLLTELDGFEARPGVLLLAATNRLDVLDPALLRPGRISRKVLVPLPDELGRRDILAVHLRNVPMASIQEKVQACERLAPLTGGFSGAELANVVNEASLLAARKQQEIITVLELLEGVQRTRFGVNGRSRRSTTPNPIMEWLARVITEPKPVKQMGSV